MAGGSVNKVIIVGNLGRDPESRTFQNGGKVANLRIATSVNAAYFVVFRILQLFSLINFNNIR